MQKQLKSENNPLNGFLLVNKTPGCTSFDIVRKINKLTQTKAGHCGTLDPFAEGMLIIALGKATRYIEYISNQNKEYIFTISWGKNTDSHDLTGNISQTSNSIPKKSDIEKAIKLFIGKTKQIPPIFSAIKVNGKRAYSYARNNQNITLSDREIIINHFKMITYSNQEATFKIECSKGTYIRSIARDLCNHLNCCGHVSYLQRTKIAQFSLSNAFSIAEIERKYNKHELSDYILNIDEMLYFIDSFYLTEELHSKLRHGSKILIKNLPFLKKDIIKLKFNKQFLGLALYKDNMLRPKKIFIN